MGEFRMPALGADMETGTLVEWLKHPGDAVKRGDIIAVVDTAKGAIEIEVFEDGIVDAVLVEPGQKVPVGATMAVIRGPATPPPVAGAAPVPGAPPVSMPAAQAVPGDRASDMRSVIAAAMARSKRDIPHYYLSTTIDMAAALTWLRGENTKRPVTERLLPVALLIKAVALALREVPELNGHWVDGALRRAAATHVGCAIALRGGGLVAPAVHDADRADLGALMRQVRDLVGRARAGSLKSSELTDPTITVTNLGEQGVDAVFGIIHPPQVALVGFGRISDRPWAAAGRVEVRPLVTATLSADHRASDGHRGGVLLAAIDRWLQTPESL
jgi:pyruvate dehydrogenase E2 component (dihydrolipoamide acetyltransferase)